jgi:uncharacterized protein YndB with AHSA1/START domain
MIKKTLLGFVAILVLFLAVAAFQPADFRVARSTTIAAPPAMVFEQVNTLKNWEAWSPWAKRDPKMKLTDGGPAAGVGATYAWAGNSEVGEGRLTITESQPHERIAIRLEFAKPFAATNTSEFLLKPEGAETHLTWSLAGQNDFLGKCFGLLMNFDKMIGRDYEQGFENLRGVLATPAKN